MLSSFKSKIGNAVLPIHLWAFSNGVILIAVNPQKMDWKNTKQGGTSMASFFILFFLSKSQDDWILTFFIENLSNNIRNLLDYRQYGAWYLHPRKWENRFQSLSDPKSIEIVKARRIPRGDKTANKQDVTTKKVSTGNKVWEVQNLGPQSPAVLSSL